MTETIRKVVVEEIDGEGWATLVPAKEGETNEAILERALLTVETRAATGVDGHSRWWPRNDYRVLVDGQEIGTV